MHISKAYGPWDPIYIGGERERGERGNIKERKSNYY